MKLKFWITAYFVIAVAFQSCGDKADNGCERLEVDLSSAEYILVDSLAGQKTAVLDSEAPIGSISQIVVEDTLVLLRTSDGLYGFNVYTGEKLAEYSRIGRANNEYLSAWSTGVDSGKVYLYDMDGKKVMYFAPDGTLLYQVSAPKTALDGPFQQIVRYGKDRYIGKRVFGAGEIPELSLYDSSFNYIGPVGDFILRSGVSMGYPFFRNGKGEVLYFRGMQNDVYVVDTAGCSKRYVVDFGSENVPERYSSEGELEIIMFLNANPGAYASCMTNIYESERYFCMMFLYDGKKGYAVYDRHENVMRPYFFSMSDAFLEQIVTHRDAAFMFWQSEEGDTMVTCIPLSLIGA